MKDPIERQDAIDAIKAIPDGNWSGKRYITAIKELPSAEPEQTDCEFCHVDSDWYVRPIEESSHAVIFGSVLYLKVKGWSGKVQIKYCPMCGRRLKNDK